MCEYGRESGFEELTVFPDVGTAAGGIMEDITDEI
jgi:hypothetical protein